MQAFKNIVHNDYHHLFPQALELEKLLDNKEEFVLIHADFYGIQSFIFEGLSSKNAAKVLRAKSAYVQVFTKVLALYICQHLGLDEKHILFDSAGKVQILSPVKEPTFIKSLQQKLDAFFIKKFFALTGVTLFTQECKKEELLKPQAFKKLLDKLDELKELSKFSKFNLLEQESVIENELSNFTPCPVCNLRSSKGELTCAVCADFITIGQQLATKNTLSIFAKNEHKSLIEIFDGFSIAFDTKELKGVKSLKTFSLKGENASLQAYVKTKENNEVMGLDDLAQESQGVQALGILKGDVDSLGSFLKEHELISSSFQNYHFFAHTLDNFFSKELPKFMQEEALNVYTVFSGGDDFFLLGAWNDIISLATSIQKKFEHFLNKKLTLSAGILLVKPTHPVSYMAQASEQALEASKEHEGKNALTLFSKTCTWQSYEETKKHFLKLLPKETNSAFLYRILDFCHMQENLHNNIKNALWRSKLNYSYQRNLNVTKNLEFLAFLEKNIEKQPHVVQMLTCEHLYQERN